MEAVSEEGLLGETCEVLPLGWEGGAVVREWSSKLHPGRKGRSENTGLHERVTLVGYVHSDNGMSAEPSKPHCQQHSLRDEIWRPQVCH